MMRRLSIELRAIIRWAQFVVGLRTESRTPAPASAAPPRPDRRVAFFTPRPRRTAADLEETAADVDHEIDRHIEEIESDLDQTIRRMADKLGSD